MKQIFAALLLLVTGLQTATAQKITYSEPDREDPRQMNYEIIGRLGGSIFTYKSFRDNHQIVVYDANMRQTQKIKLDFLPDKVINCDFITYPDYFYLIYQHQRKGNVFCTAVKFDKDGKRSTDPQVLDTTEVNFWANNRLYNLVVSQNKQYIGLYKVNSRNDKKYILGHALFSKDLTLVSKSKLEIAMPERNDYLSDFALDDEGDLAFLSLSGTSQSDNINKMLLVLKPKAADSLQIKEIPLKSMYLDDARIKADNKNRNFLIVSFFTKQRRGNIDGIFATVYNKLQQQFTVTQTNTISEEVRTDARSQGSTRTAFNDYFLEDIIVREDGGFIIAAESVYSQNRGGTYNRWDYFYGNQFVGTTNYYSWNNWNDFAYPWSRFNSTNNQITRYYAENIAVLSFASNAQMEWANIIRKSQYDDYSDDLIGYGVVNTGDAAHFIFNVLEKKNLILNEHMISPEGQLSRNPTFKNLDKGYEFMPRHGKQVGSRTFIVPCTYRNYICFAKIEI
jgi:hypothetical protein